MCVWLKQYTFSSPISSTEAGAAAPVVRTEPTMQMSRPTGGLLLKKKPEPQVTVIEDSSDEEEATPSGGFKAAATLKAGSVMDILGGKNSKSTTAGVVTTSGFGGMFAQTCSTSTTAAVTTASGFGGMFAQAADSWSCPTCMVTNKAEANKCPCCETPKPGANQPSGQAKAPAASRSPTKSLFSAELTSNASSQWECPTCMVRNSNDKARCPCCETAKPGAGKTDTQTSLSSMFKPSADTWECATCMIRNNTTFVRCAACGVSKPGGTPANTTVNTSKPATGPSQPSLSSMFKKPAGNWDCDTCMVSNRTDITQCIACETPRPGLKKTTSFTSAGGFAFGSAADPPPASVAPAVTNGGFQVPSSTFGSKESVKLQPGGGFQIGAPISSSKSGDNNNKVKFGGESSSKSEVTSATLSFGGFGSSSSDKPDSTSNSISTTTGGKSTTGGFQIESSTKSDKKLPTGFQFGVPAEAKATTTTEKAPAFGGFKFGGDTGEKKDVKAGLFGGSSTDDKSSVIVSTSSTEEKKDLVGVNSSGVFGKSDLKATAGIFGRGAPDTKSVSGGIFGSVDKQPASTSAENTSVFGKTSSSLPTSKPENSSSVASSVFGSSNSTSQASKGGFSFTPTKPADSSSSVFGATTTTASTASSVFGAAPASTGGAASVFGAVATTTSTTSSSSQVTDTNKPNLFTFGQPPPALKQDPNKAVSGSTAIGGFSFKGSDSKPAPSSTFGFSGGNTSNNSAPPPVASNLFGFGAASKPPAGIGGSTESVGLGQKRERGQDEAVPGKKNKQGANLFGSSGGTGFNFAPSSSVTTATTSGGFGGFGATPAPAFGSGGSTNAFGATPSMAFGGSTASGNTSTAEAAAKQGLFQFGSPAPATANSSTISSPPGAAFVFGQPTSSMTGTTGGFGAPPAPAGSGYNFGGSTPAPSFNFGAGGGGAGPVASSQPAGGAFQFSAGNPGDNPNPFTASNTGTPTGSQRRPIKRAVRKIRK